MITKQYIEQIIYDWVVENFGKSEAKCPSWNTEALAQHLTQTLNNPPYKKQNKIIYED